MAEIDPGNTSSYDILERFIKSGLHPEDSNQATWPKETTVVCLIVKLDNTQGIAIKHNITGHTHAEVVLVEYFKKKLDSKEIKSITIYINYSPCSDCSVELLILKGKVPDLQIIFSAFYYIRRSSCTQSCGCSTADSKAFGKLIELGAMPFQEKDWRDLIKLLKQNDVQKKNRNSDLDGLRYGDMYEDWRNGEDTKMMVDYNKLKPSSPSGGGQVGDLADSLQRVSLGD